MITGSWSTDRLHSLHVSLCCQCIARSKRSTYGMVSAWALRSPLTCSWVCGVCWSAFDLFLAIAKSAPDINHRLRQIDISMPKCGITSVADRCRNVVSQGTLTFPKKRWKEAHKLLKTWWDVGRLPANKYELSYIGKARTDGRNNKKNGCNEILL